MRCILPSTVATILLSFQGCFTAPTYFTFQLVTVGWILAQDRRITSIILASDGLRWRSFSTFHRFFSAARWSMDGLFRTAFLLVMQLIPAEAVIVLAVDDTLTHSFGKHVWGAGMHHDAIR